MEIVQLVDLAAVDTFIWQKLKVIESYIISMVFSALDDAVVVCVKIIYKKPKIGVNE